MNFDKETVGGDIEEVLSKHYDGNVWPATNEVIKYFETLKAKQIETVPVKLSAPTNCEVNPEKRTIELSEYGEHIITLSYADFDEIIHARLQND